MNCIFCITKLSKRNRLGILYLNNNTYVMSHWSCIKDNLYNTYVDDYIGIKRQYADKIKKWNELTKKEQTSSKSLLMRVKIYGCQSCKKIHISGMEASSNFMSPDDVQKIYDNHAKDQKQKKQSRKEEYVAKYKIELAKIQHLNPDAKNIKTEYRSNDKDIRIIKNECEDDNNLPNHVTI